LVFFVSLRFVGVVFALLCFCVFPIVYSYLIQLCVFRISKVHVDAEQRLLRPCLFFLVSALFFIILVVVVVFGPFVRGAL
jgi:hypothetical protein